LRTFARLGTFLFANLSLFAGSPFATLVRVIVVIVVLLVGIVVVAAIVVAAGKHAAPYSRRKRWRWHQPIRKEMHARVHVVQFFAERLRDV